MAMSATSKLLRKTADSLLDIVQSVESQHSAVDTAVELDEDTGVPLLLRYLRIRYLDPLCTHLNTIVDTLNELKEYDASFSRDKSPPATLMSISQLRGVYTAVELIWCWGIIPSIKGCVKVEEKEIYPKSILVPQTVMVNTQRELISVARPYPQCDDDVNTLRDMLDVLERTCSSFVFGAMMLGRNLKRILIGSMALEALCEMRTPSSGTHTPATRML